MFSRSPLTFRQKFARASRCDNFVFAPSAGLRDDQAAHFGRAFSAGCATECYPFPSLRSGPKRVRPLFSWPIWRRIADAENRRIFQFEFVGNVVESGFRTTNQRGSSPCVNPSSYLHLQSCRLPAACSPTPPQPAQALVPCRGPHLVRSQITRLQNRLWSAVPSGPLPATQAFAAKSASTAIYFGIKASCGQSATGFSHFARHRAVKEREPCSRKS